VKYTKTSLSGAFLIDLEPRSDERGFFSRYFCKNEFDNKGLNTTWVQINNSMTQKRGTVRGLHLQSDPYAEVKLIRCFRGAIWDVIVDLRRHSPTFGKWFGFELNESNRTMLYVPQGFAHGFISLMDESECIYLVSNYYSSSHERTLMWNDPDVGIEWPIEMTYISEKDQLGKRLANFN
jgi:dTDP-4-dehydrorhamnose 3,5-epimerase